MECAKYYCASCAQRHVSVAAFKQHHIITMATGSEASLRKCKDHSNELLTYYCVTCHQFVCSLCMTDTHHTCEVKIITEVSGMAWIVWRPWENLQWHSQAALRWSNVIVQYVRNFIVYHDILVAQSKHMSSQISLWGHHHIAEVKICIIFLCGIFKMQ